jgi:transposase
MLLMAKPIVSDELWEIIKPLIPEKKRRFRYPGRKPISNCEALTGILFVLKTGIGWDDLLASAARMAKSWSMGQYTQITVEQITTSRPNRLFPCGGRFIVSAGCFWGAKTGPNPTDRRKKGSKHHLVTDANGIPLSVILTGANRHDVTQLLPLVDSIPAIAGKVGRPLQCPDSILGDRGYDSEPHRRQLRSRGIVPLLAKRWTENGSGLGIYRWVIERSISWLHQNRRLRIRYEKRDDIHQAFLTIGCIKICWNHLLNYPLC